MKYIKKLLVVVVYPIILLLGEFFCEYIFVFLFNKHEIQTLKHTYSNLSNHQITKKLNNLITTSDYQTRLMNYLNNHSLLIALIVAAILIPFFVLKYKKYRITENKIKGRDIIFIILLGVSVSLLFNITFNQINTIYFFTDQFSLGTIPIYVQIVSSGIIGPILEELVFRGNVYNKLKTFNPNMRAIILTSIIFAIFHISNPLNVLYAFMMSFLFVYVYEKYKKLRYPILLHISANTAVILAMTIILKQIIWLNVLIWILSLIVLMFLYFKFIKKDV